MSKTRREKKVQASIRRKLRTLPREKKSTNSTLSYYCSSFSSRISYIPRKCRHRALRQHGRRAKPRQRQGAKSIPEVLLPGGDTLVGAGGVQDDSIRPGGGGKGGGNEEGRRLEGKRREQQEAGLHGWVAGGCLCL